MEANCKEAAKFCELLEFDDSIEVFVALQIPLKVFNSTHFPTIR